MNRRTGNHPVTETEKLMIRGYVLTLFGAVALCGTAAIAKKPMVGGQEMFQAKNIVENAMNSADHTTLVAAVKAAELVGTLQSPGPFTVFAPVNSAFAKLPAGTVETFLKPENKDTLVKVLTYHVVAGKLSGADLKTQIKMGGGKAMLKTVAGGSLWAMMDGKNIVLKDEKGGMSKITQADVFQSNGVIHVLDTVVMDN